MRAGTFYPYGGGAHIHYRTSGERTYCTTKHRKPVTWPYLTIAIAVVEAMLILFLINRAW